MDFVVHGGKRLPTLEQGGRRVRGGERDGVNLVVRGVVGRVGRKIVVLRSLWMWMGH